MYTNERTLGTAKLSVCPSASCLINYSEISCYGLILPVAGECWLVVTPTLYETHTKLSSMHLKRLIVQKVGKRNSGCCMTLRRAGDLWIWKRKHYIALCGELAVEEDMDLSQDRRRDRMSERMKEQTVYIIDCEFSQYLLSARCITQCKLRCDPLFLQSCFA